MHWWTLILGILIGWLLIPRVVGMFGAKSGG